MAKGKKLKSACPFQPVPSQDQMEGPLNIEPEVPRATLWQLALVQFKFWLKMTYSNPLLWFSLIAMTAVVAIWALRYGKPKERLEDASERLFEERDIFRFLRHFFNDKT